MQTRSKIMNFKDTRFCDCLWLDPGAVFLVWWRGGRKFAGLGVIVIKKVHFVTGTPVHAKPVFYPTRQV